MKGSADFASFSYDRTRIIGHYCVIPKSMKFCVARKKEHLDECVRTHPT